MYKSMAVEGKTEISRVATVGGLGVTLVLVVGMMLLVVTGVVETLGYESRNINGNGLSSTNTGSSFGLKYFYFSKGQKFFAEYDAVIQKGSLFVHLTKLGSMPTGDSPYSQKIFKSGKGTVTFPIQENGLYKMSVSGSVLGADSRGRGYDISYSIRWGVR